MTLRRCYIRYREDLPDSAPHAIAALGFRARGTETVPFYGFGDIRSLSDLGHDTGLAGFVGDVWEALDHLHIPRPPSLDYPPSLKAFLGRSIETLPLSEVRTITHRRLFIKPHKQKLFTGFVTSGTFEDQVRLGPYDDDELCWVSPPLPFQAEYRCCVLRGDILAARHYKGDWSRPLDRNVVLEAVQAYHDAPAAYTLDMGVTTGGQTLLIEVNDGFAFGPYGLPATLYAQMLEARWQELVVG